jgi:hypothetical protein
MAQEIIDFGSYPNDANADPVRTAFQKTQNNFTELYTVVATTGVQRVVATSGLTQDVQTGNVTLAANIANVTIQTGPSLLVGLGAATGNTATITTGTTPFVITVNTTISTQNIIATNSLTGTLTTNSQPNITSVGNLTSLNVVGNITGSSFTGNVNANVIIANFYTAPKNSGNRQILYNKAGVMDGSSEVTWDETTLNVIGNITAQNINGGNSFTANFITGTLRTNAQPNITSVGTLVNVNTVGNVVAAGNVTAHTFNGNVKGGYIEGTYKSPGDENELLLNGSGNISASEKLTFDGNIFAVNANMIAQNINSGNLLTANFITGVLTSSSQPNIRSVGNLVSLVVGNNTSLGNLTVAGAATFDADIYGNTLTVTGNTQLTTLLAGNITAARFTGNGASLSAITGANVTGIVANANFAAFSNVANFANFAGNVTVNAQPNITSLGNLTNLSVVGNVFAADMTVNNAITANFLIGSGEQISNITGANVVGNVNTAVLSYFSNVTEFAYSNLGFYSGEFRMAFVSGNAGGAGNLRIQTNDHLNFEANTGYLSVPKLKALDEIRTAITITNTLTVNANANVSGNINVTNDANVLGNIKAINTTLAGDIAANNARIVANLEAANGNLIGVLTVGTLIDTEELNANGNIISNNLVRARQLDVTGNIFATGNITSGSITTNGHINVLGNITGRNLTLTGYLNNSLIPNADDSFDLGADDDRFRNLYVNEIIVGDSVLTSSSETLNTNHKLSVNQALTANEILSNTKITTDELLANTANVFGPLVVDGATVINAGLIAAGINSTNNILANGFVRGTNVISLGNVSAVQSVTALNMFANANLSVTNTANIGTLNVLNDITSSANVIADNLLLNTGTVYARGLNAGGNTIVGNITGKWKLTAGSTMEATFADLAEYYAGDNHIEPGTVVSFGGANEVTTCLEHMSTKVAGVVSTNPAYIMNSMIECEYPIVIALQGRVPVKVTGIIEKGDMLVSAGNGMATSSKLPVLGSIIGKALENFSGIEGTIEVAVGKL